MTDRERLEQLLRDWGVSWQETSRWEEASPGKHAEFPGQAIEVSVLEGGPKVNGYGAFYAQFSFLGDGSFCSIGIWE